VKSAVIVFPGSNCDRDLAEALRLVSGAAPAMIWHRESELPAGLDLIAIPGGFSYGDYLRAGAIAARSPIMATIRDEMGRQLSGMVWQANRLPLGMPTEKLTYFDDQHPSTTDQSIPVPAELIESMPWTSVEIALSVQTQLPT